MRPSVLERVLSPGYLIRCAAMDGKQGTAILHGSLKALCLIFGYTHPDKSTNNSTHSSTNPKARERAHDRPRRNQWAHTGNRKGTDTCEEAKRAANDAARRYTGDSTLGGLSVLLMREGTGALVVGKKN